MLTFLQEDLASWWSCFQLIVNYVGLEEDAWN
jgi:hypothetical protein